MSPVSEALTLLLEKNLCAEQLMFRAMQQISTGDELELDLPFSQAVEQDGVIYVSGQVALDPATGTLIDGDIADETRRILDNIAAILESANSGMDDVVKVTLYITDIDEFDAINEVYGTYFEPPFPARTAVEVDGLAVETGLEIDAVAMR